MIEKQVEVVKQNISNEVEKLRKIFVESPELRGLDLDFISFMCMIFGVSDKTASELNEMSLRYTGATSEAERIVKEIAGK